MTEKICYLEQLKGQPMKNHGLATGIKACWRTNNTDPRDMKKRLMLAGPDFIQRIANYEFSNPDWYDKFMWQGLGFISLRNLQIRMARKLVISGEYRNAIEYPNSGMLTVDGLHQLYQKHIVDGEPYVEIPSTRQLLVDISNDLSYIKRELAQLNCAK